MTKKQLAALRRILDRETAAYQGRPDRPAPGQHLSRDKYAVTDGTVCVLMGSPEPTLPMGAQVDSLIEIVQNERKSEAHFPVPANQISVPKWKAQIKQQKQEIEISAPIIRPEQLTVSDLDATDALTAVVGHFALQLLVDAAEAVGGDPLFFLGYGPFNTRFPSLLIMPPMWIDKSGAESMAQDPIALVLPLRR